MGRWSSSPCGQRRALSGVLSRCVTGRAAPGRWKRQLWSDKGGSSSTAIQNIDAQRPKLRSLRGEGELAITGQIV